MIKEIAERHYKDERVTLKKVRSHNWHIGQRSNAWVVLPSHYLNGLKKKVFGFYTEVEGDEIWFLMRMKPKINWLTIFNKKAYCCDKKKIVASISYLMNML